MLQRTPEWLMARLGRFTASDIHRLMGKEGLATTRQSIETYASEKAAEMYFGLIDDDYISADMQRGIDIEPDAFNRYADSRAVDFVTVEKCGFIPLGDHAGASPDGRTSDGVNVEIKCPRIVTFSRLAMTREVDPKHYAQMHLQMICTGTERSHYYNYVVHNGTEYDLTIEVTRDEQYCGLMLQRIEQAAEVKMRHYDALVAQLGRPYVPQFIASHDEQTGAMIVEQP